MDSTTAADILATIAVVAGFGALSTIVAKARAEWRKLRPRLRGISVAGAELTFTAQLDELSDLEPHEVLAQIAAAEQSAVGSDRVLLDELEQRIKEIEEQFPSASTIDKVASVNDAILATRLEALQKEVDELRATAVGKWTVAAIVGGMMVGVAGIVAAVIQGMDYLKP
jgi:hypothetical protein